MPNPLHKPVTTQPRRFPEARTMTVRQLRLMLETCDEDKPVHINISVMDATGKPIVQASTSEFHCTERGDGVHLWRAYGDELND